MALWICICPILAAIISAPFGVSIARVIASLGVVLQALLLVVGFGWDGILEGTYIWFPFAPTRLGITHVSTLFLTSNIAASLFAMWLGWRQELEGRIFFQHILLTNAAVSALVVTQKLVAIPFFWELSAIPLTLGIALWGKKDATYTASSFVGYQLLFGLVIAASMAGVASITTQLFGVVSHRLPNPASPLQPWISWAVTFALLGKMGVFPFHGWVAATYRSVHPSGAIILVGSFLAGTLAMALNLRPLLQTDVFVVAGLVSYVYCSFLAFRVDNFRALTACLLGSQLGLCAIALVTSKGAFLLLVTQVLIVFSVLGALVGIIEKRRGESSLSSVTGLARTTPRLGAFLILFLTATLPLPLLPAFPGVFLLINGALPQWVLPILAVTLLFQMTLIIQVCENLFRRNLPKGVREVKELKLREWWALIPATFTILMIGAFSARVLRFLTIN